MKLKEIKQWIDSLPKEFLEFDVVNGEIGRLPSTPGSTDDELIYRLDKPITTLAVDEKTKEVIFLNEKKNS